LSDDNLDGAPAEATAPNPDAALFYPDDAPQEPATPAADPVQPEADPEQPPEYQLQLPEGVKIDADLLATATPVMRELGLSDEQASKLVPLAQEVQGKLLSDMMAHHVELRTGWARDAKADPTIGGAQWSDSVRIASSALTAGGAPPGSEVRKLLNETGLGDHPAFIRLFRNLGLQLAGSSMPPKTDADLFYPRR